MPGLDKTVVKEIEWSSAIKNIAVDSRTDFILSPHLDVIYREKGGELIQQLCSALTSGSYEPQLPMTISVPKKGILTRPGSILLPQDRLLYQGLVEDMLPQIESQFDRNIAFSHIPSDKDGELFKPSHECWGQFQEQIESICGNNAFVLQCDVANFFETLPQHNLINALEGCGSRTEAVRLLEKVLSIFRQKSSQGIIQGVYPSDVLGNFYLTDFDANFSLANLASARYVDDIYVGFPDELQAKTYLNSMVEDLRKVGLSLNPDKTKITQASDLLFEQKEVDLLFDAARDELDSIKDFVEEGGYGFQGDWINSDDVEAALDEDDEIELLAVRSLIDFVYESEDQAEKIDRFCLPYLRASGDDYGVERAFNGLISRPHLTRLYFSYLNHFAKINLDVQNRIEELIRKNGFHLDYQKMYYMAGVLPCESVDARTVRHVTTWFNSPMVGSATRAIAAIFIAKFGTARDRRAIRAKYDNEDPYVRAAILYSAQYFISAEKATMRTAWKGHSEINSLIASAI
ncbi:RNA-directed DNA polymerase [Amylibacter sp. SFDW26]|uniref:RNA-directed DNA polymerase n=1 Tax=Amylibacter sp. SFDW26 TaxID=2652722 RepID=UPI00126237D8|nr:RNA-directed DNA polymerase [Amylibacter sp. SFDW26]KAB7613410.1 RNA-directed DNA polymerase [Amylibacter sp. SFDW26]